MKTLSLAVNYRDGAGFSVIPIRVNGSKAAAVEWDAFKRRKATDGEFRQWFPDRRSLGIAVVCGEVSGNLEILDIDETSLVEPFLELVRETFGQKFCNRLLLINTPRPGLHIPYRCSEISGHQDFAKGLRPDEDNPGPLKEKALIEVRAEGNYAILPGSLAEVHSKKKPYTVRQGRFSAIPTLTPEQRALLHNLARSFNEILPKLSADGRDGAEAGQDGCRPGDDFGAKTSWMEILEPHGWKQVRERDGIGYWRRPGKKDPGISATTGHEAHDIFFCFSSNGTPFEAGKGYSKFTAFALLNHGGDFETAARELRRRGYGKETEAKAGAAGAQEWPEPIDLDELELLLPEMPLEAIPEPLATWAFDLSDRTNAAIEFAVTAGLAALAGLTGRRVRIRPKRHDDWKVIPNLWAGLIGPSGTLKSPILNEAVSPLHSIEATYRQDFDAAHKVYEQAAERYSIAREAWRGQAKREKAKGREFGDLEESQPEPPCERRLVTSDCTSEKLHELLAANEAGIIVVLKDELVSLMATMQRPERAADRGFLLTGWNGMDPYTVDRIGRGSIHAPAVCVAIIGRITPAKFRSYLSADSIKNGGDDGFAARFQLLAYPDTPPARLVDRVPDFKAKRDYFSIFERVAQIDCAAPIELSFDDPAQELFNAWLLELETAVRDREMPDHLKAVKSKQRKLMPALAGLIHLVENTIPARLSLHDAQRAAALCEVYWRHALKAYGALGAGGIEAAKDLLKKIRKGDIGDGFSLKSVYDNGWTGLSNAEDVRKAVDILIEAHWLRQEQRPTEGRTATVYRVNPAAMR